MKFNKYTALALVAVMSASVAAGCGEKKNSDTKSESGTVPVEETTEELVSIIEKSIPKSKQKDGHPAKRTFQAIRIEVNDELKPLYNTVMNSIMALKDGGRLCVITFHSLEDRAVKQAYSDAEGRCTCPKDLPYCICNYKSYGKVVNKKPIVSTEEELKENSRAQSAKLRIFERKEVKTYGK